jgi:hypothetical protein
VHQAEIDAACELIDFWRFNVAYIADELYEEQPISPTGLLEPRRAAAAGRLRVRGDAVQLHGHRRQPPDRSGPDGQHVVWKPSPTDAVGAGDHEAARGGGPAAGGHQLRARRAADPSAKRCSRTRTGRPALHRLDTRCSRASVATRSATNIARYRSTRASSVRRAARTSSSRTRRRRRAEPSGRGDRARRLRVPGPEVLGRVPRLHAAVAVVSAAGAAGGTIRVGEGRRRLRLLELHGRRHRPARLRQDQGLHRSRARHAGARDPGAAGPATTAWATSSQPTLVRADDPRSKLMVEEIFGPVVTVFVYDGRSTSRRRSTCATRRRPTR